MAKREDWPLRFWRKVNKTPDCWLWIAGQNGYGYGSFCKVRLHPMLAHRIAWEWFNGPLPIGSCAQGSQSVIEGALMATNRVEQLARRLALLKRLIDNGVQLSAQWDDLLYWTARNAARDVSL